MRAMHRRVICMQVNQCFCECKHVGVAMSESTVKYINRSLLLC